MKTLNTSVERHMLNGQTVLIVESEFLIALDIQRCLEVLGATQTVFARNTDEAFAFAERWRDFSMALIEVRHQHAKDAALLQALAEVGIKLVLLSSDTSLRRGHSSFPAAPMVMKPFLEHDLASALKQALAD